MAELDLPGLPSDRILLIDRLFECIESSPVFLCLLAGTGDGTAVEIAETSVHMSYWEAELFYAALQHKEIHVLVTEGFHPGPRIKLMLDLLRFAMPSQISPPLPRRELVLRVRELLSGQSGKPPGGPTRLLAHVLDQREARPIGGHAEESSLRFVDGRDFDPTVEPNPALLEDLLEAAEAQATERRRLAVLWPLYRQLMAVPHSRPENRSFLPSWSAFYEAWAKAASWYGLHGHIHLGPLAALNSLAQLRLTMRRLPGKPYPAAWTEYPGSALASARYSLAKLLGRGRRRRDLLRAALADLDRSLADGTSKLDEALAVRGSIFQRQGRLLASLEDYKRVVALRRQGGASEAKLGEGLAELGFGYTLLGRALKGRDLISEGVELLHRDPRRTGFLIRAKRKLALTNGVLLNLRAARDEMASAAALAAEFKVADQQRQIERMRLVKSKRGRSSKNAPPMDNS